MSPAPSTKWTQWMTVDMRALGAFRIALAFTILIDLADRARTLILYTEDGPLPFAMHDGMVFTLHRGPPAAIVALFVVHAVVAVVFGVGWKTRLIAPLLFALQVSLQNRCYISIYLGDDLLRAQLFWACVLPVGARFSIDSRFSRAPEALRSFAAGGVVLVPVTIFFFTALEKLVSPAWRDGRALGLFVDTWIYPTTIGTAFLDNAPALFPPMTMAAVAFELFLPLLLLTSWWRARLLGAIGLFALMFCIAIMLDVGLFPLITATALVPLVPSQLWSSTNLRATLTSRSTSPVDVPVRLARNRALDKVALAAGLTMIVTSGLNMAEVSLPLVLDNALKIIGLNQRWPMFTHPEAAPRGWFLIAGRGTDGRQWDLLEGGPLVATRVPNAISAVDIRFRERRVLHRAYIGADGYEEVAADWLCRRNAIPLATVSVGYAEVRGDPPNVLVIELLKEHPCPPARTE